MVSVVFITGGARRIGKRLVERFAERGFRVGFTYNTSAQDAQTLLKHLQQSGVVAEAVQCDVTNAEQLTESMASLAETLGVPDIIVSNAGVFPRQQSSVDLTEEQFLGTIKTNTLPLHTLAKYLMTLPAADNASQQSARRLIALSSLGGVEIWKERIDYNTSKSALMTLVKALARDTAPTLTVNSVAPGAIINPDDETESDASLTAVSRIPMARYGTADDVFDAVWFFATASSYVTGQTLLVDGGYHQYR